MKAKKQINTVVVTILILVGIFMVVILAAHKIKNPYIHFGKIYDYGNIFSIGIYIGDSPFHLHESKKIVNPVITASDVTDRDASFVADPFLIHANERWYLFFEVMDKKSKQGDLGVAISDDTIKWKYQKIILDEPFHLSYPDVFSDGKDFYMIPETGATKSVRLYKAIDFPFKWKFEKTLLKGLRFVDPTIFKYHDKWWLFVETNPHTAGTLRLYYSDKIRGPWKEHPKSPIINGDANISRSGGRIELINDKLFRVAQDDWPTYGNAIRIFQVDRLTTSEYSEHELYNGSDYGCNGLIIESKNMNTKDELPKWRSEGMHQLDSHQISQNNWIACIDGKSKAKIGSHWVLDIRIP